MNRTGRCERGFTLIELLVVISILGMLIALLFPSMQRMRDRTKDLECANKLREIYRAQSIYLQNYKRFPNLNKERDDGKWQYNYLIYDGKTFDRGFGPLLADGSTIDDIESLYCPRQKDPYHSMATPENNWPVIPLADTRAGYGMRYHLSGKSLSQMRNNPAILTDLIHLPKLIKSAHKTGINAAYADGHVQWVVDTGFLTDNELTHPFAFEDNEIIEDIWDDINKAGR